MPSQTSLVKHISSAYDVNEYHVMKLFVESVDGSGHPHGYFFNLLIHS